MNDLEISADYNKRELVPGSRKWVKHVRCNGARFHVLSWNGGNGRARRHCSEANCIVNRPQDST